MSDKQLRRQQQDTRARGQEQRAATHKEAAKGSAALKLFYALRRAGKTKQ